MTTTANTHTTPTTQAVFRAILTNAPKPPLAGETFGTPGDNLALMDAGAIVTHTRLHPNGVEIFFLANPEVPQEEYTGRLFRLARTGEPVPATAKYIGTVGPAAHPALHVFEIL